MIGEEPAWVSPRETVGCCRLRKTQEGNLAPSIAAIRIASVKTTVCGSQADYRRSGGASPRNAQLRPACPRIGRGRLDAAWLPELVGRVPPEHFSSWRSSA